MSSVWTSVFASLRILPVSSTIASASCVGARRDLCLEALEVRGALGLVSAAHAGCAAAAAAAASATAPDRVAGLEHDRAIGRGVTRHERLAGRRHELRHR